MAEINSGGFTTYSADGDEVDVAGILAAEGGGGSGGGDEAGGGEDAEELHFGG